MVSQIEPERSVSLQKFMSDEGLRASPEEESRRRNVIDKLQEILITWIKRVAYQRRLPLNQIENASVILLPYGSYALGVYDSDSNINLLCVAPCFASMKEDFFIVLHNMLASRPEVSGIQCVKDAKIPLLKFCFQETLIELPFAKLQVTSVPENVDIFNPSFVNDMDEASWKSLSVVQVKNSILQLVPNVKIFQELLRCVRLWAKRRGVYNDLFGFFGGFQLAVLAAFICEKNSSVCLIDLISIFFKTFALWPWPQPVVVVEDEEELEEEKEKEEVALTLPPGTQSLMPIQYCDTNLTTNTFNKIRAEFRRGYRLTQDPLNPYFEWRNLFEPFPYAKSYFRFIKICLSTHNKDENLGTWVHRVKSHIRTLLVKLEELHAMCDPNPTEYIDMNIRVPNVVYYWGLIPGRADNMNLNAVNEYFMKHLCTEYEDEVGRMTLTIVQLPKTLELAKNHIKHQLKLSKVIHDQRMIPVYSIHSPGYLLGYLANRKGDGDGDSIDEEDQILEQVVVE